MSSNRNRSSRHGIQLLHSLGCCFFREILTLKDGGEVALDWMDNNCSDDSPVILLLPGLTGASQSEYIKCLVTTACDIGARVVVFNNRGLGGVALKV